MRREVIVVGAGPAGSTAAAALARRGRDVLLIDRAEFPRDKACGDGIPPGTVAILRDLGMDDALRGAGFYSIRSIRLVSARSREWRADFDSRLGSDFYIAPRVRLDDLIRRHALAMGAEFLRANARAPLLDGNRITGVRVETDDGAVDLHADVVIAADGATSALARALAPRKAPESHRGVAIRAYLEGIETLPHTVEFHFRKEFAPGYGWVFPLAHDRANVGVVMRTDRFRARKESLQKLLEAFLAGPDLSRRMRGQQCRDLATWQLPYATTAPPRLAFDGAIVVGDAAGLVDSLTGEGIHNAVSSAHIAAEVVDRALARGDTSRTALRAFDERAQREVVSPARRSYHIQKYVTAFPPVLETLFLLAGLAPAGVNHWINRHSTDYVVHPGS